MDSKRLKVFRIGNEEKKCSEKDLVIAFGEKPKIQSSANWSITVKNYLIIAFLLSKLTC